MENSLSEYELLRLRNIERNHEFLKSLGEYSKKLIFTRFTCRRPRQEKGLIINFTEYYREGEGGGESGVRPFLVSVKRDVLKNCSVNCD